MDIKSLASRDDAARRGMQGSSSMPQGGAMPTILGSGWSAAMQAGRAAVRDVRGATIVKFALAFPILAALLAVPIDYGRYMHQRATLRAATDAASLAAARQMSLTDTRSNDMTSAVEATVTDFLAAHAGVTVNGAPTVASSIRSDPITVSVLARQPFTGAFSALSAYVFPDVVARSEAQVVGRPNICVLGLNPSANRTISLEHNAMVTGQNCAVYSNSTHTNAIVAKNSATLRASIICSRGGKSGGPGNFDPQPITDCPGFDDPLAARPEPMPAACEAAEATAITTDTELSPGTYCGLRIGNGAAVTLRAGTYIFKDAPLVVTENASLSGSGVALYFAGDGTGMLFDAQSTIDLAGPTSGPLAGMLLFGSRSLDGATSFRIVSNNARKLTGTIYIPSGELRIDADAPVADRSAYTAIVADTMRLFGGPHLVLNTSYDETEVPVPEGIKGAGMPARLAR